MPLLKLWKSIVGRGSTDQAAEHPASAAESASTASVKTKSKAVAKPAKSKNVLAMSFGGPHASVAKLAKKADPNSDQPLRVLEIGVDDGQRCLAVVAALTAKRAVDQLQYSVIDTFEMGDGPVTMRDFNKLAREASLKPQLFPMPVEAGIMRLAHTLGSVDLILDGDRFHATENGIKLLSKVMHATTVMLSEDEGEWRVVDWASSSGKRSKAA